MRVALVALPTPGHVNPMLPLAAELVRGGDRVVVAAPTVLAPAVAATGAEVISLGDLPIPSGEPGGPAARAAAEAFFASVRGVVEAALADLAADPPDALVYDALLPMMGAGDPRAVAVPRAAFFPSFAIAEGTRLGDLAPRDPATGAPVMFPHGDEPAPAEGLNIVPVPRAYQPDADAFDGRYLFVGPSLREEPEAADFPLPPDDGQPLVFVSLGTVASDNLAFYRTAIDALAVRPWRAVVATGRADPAALGALPANVVARRWTPQIAVLRAADLFVTHGGANSVMEALSLATPMVVVPQAADQFAHAGRVAALGLGIAVGPAPSTAVLLEAMDAVLSDPGYRERAAAMQPDVSAGGGAARAAAAVRALARGEAPVPAWW